MDRLRIALSDVLSPDADLEDLRYARQRIAELDPATVRLVLDQALESLETDIRAELD